MARVGGAGGGLGKHIDGETRPESAAPRELDVEGGEKVALEPVVLLDVEGEQIDQVAAKKRVRAAQGYMRECRRNKTRGRQPMGAATWVFAGPPRYDGEKEPPWSAEKVRAWSKDCVKWLVDRAGPGSRLAHCALHQDEGAPHLHATLIVADEQGRLGWNRVRNRFTVKGKTGTLLMSGLQDNFHEAVGRKHGLERGEVGSSREHAPVDRDLGIRIRVEEERNRTHEAKVHAGKRIAEVLERADGEAAQKHRKRLDAATSTAADADERAARATEERNEARRERDRAVGQRDRARAAKNLSDETLRSTLGELYELKQDNARLRRDGVRIHELWGERAAAQVTAAKQESADELAKAQQDLVEVRRARGDLIHQVGTLGVERDQARRERSQARQEAKTMAAERDQAREDRDRESRWGDRLVKVVRELGPVRRELEEAADRAEMHPDDRDWLVKEVERGRGRDR